jgi:hypothetical protein
LKEHSQALNLVEVGDVATGDDLDRPQNLSQFRF